MMYKTVKTTETARQGKLKIRRLVTTNDSVYKKRMKTADLVYFIAIINQQF